MKGVLQRGGNVTRTYVKKAVQVEEGGEVVERIVVSDVRKEES